MKKVFVLCLALLLALPLFAGCTKKKTTDTPSPDSPAPQSSATESFDHCSELPPDPADGKLTLSREGKTLTVKITLESDKNSAVSLLLLDDPAYTTSWAENPEHLIDLAEAVLDDKGEATLTLQLKDENAVCHLILTTKSGVFTAKVNG